MLPVLMGSSFDRLVATDLDLHPDHFQDLVKQQG